jgi:predicted nucleic acid-binding protein
MPKLLIDLNVILDVLLKRSPHAEASTQVLALAERGQIDARICAASVDTLEYLLTKTLSRKAARKHLHTLLRILKVISVDQAVIDAALALNWPDLEDAIVYQSARLAGLQGIVSRDGSGFRGGELAVLTPLELLSSFDS